jgi:hypothetical protein
MDRRPRWDGDKQMTGLADGTPMLVALEAMSSAMRDAGWVTEEPAAHLGSKLTAWLAEQGQGRWTNVELEAEERWLVVSAQWNRPGGRMRDLRADAFALIGSFVEDIAHVVQRRVGDAVDFEIATGQGAGVFAPHGHLVRFRATGSDVERAGRGLR